MEAVQQKVSIPANKQVLLSADGEPLNPNHRVASYASAGTVMFSFYFDSLQRPPLTKLFMTTFLPTIQSCNQFEALKIFW